MLSSHNPGMRAFFRLFPPRPRPENRSGKPNHLNTNRYFYIFQHEE